MSKLLTGIGFSLLLSSFLYGGSLAVVKVDNANIRNESNMLQDSIVQNAQFGESFGVEKIDSKWVKLSNTYYIEKSLVKIVSDEPTLKAKVISSSATAQSSKNITNNTKIRGLKKGSTVEVVTILGKWAVLKDGYVVNSKSIKLLKKERQFKQENKSKSTKNINTGKNEKIVVDTYTSADTITTIEEKIEITKSLKYLQQATVKLLTLEPEVNRNTKQLEKVLLEVDVIKSNLQPQVTLTDVKNMKEAIRVLTEQRNRDSYMISKLNLELEELRKEIELIKKR